MMSNSMVQIEDDLGDLPPNVLITDASETAIMGHWCGKGGEACFDRRYYRA